MPPIDVQGLKEKKKQGKDLFSQRRSRKLDIFVRALRRAGENMQRRSNVKDAAKIGKKLVDFSDTIFEAIQDPDPPEHSKRIEGALDQLEELGDFLGGPAPSGQHSNVYDLILSEGPVDEADESSIEEGLEELNEICELGIPLNRIKNGEVVQSTREEKQERQDRQKRRDEAREARERQEKERKLAREREKLRKQQEELEAARKRQEEEDRRKAEKQALEQEKLRKQQEADERRRQAEDNRRKAEELARLQKEEQEQKRVLKEEEERKLFEARDRNDKDREILVRSIERSKRSYRKPNSDPELKKLDMANAVAFHRELERLQKDRLKSFSEDRIKEDMRLLYNSAEFAIAEAEGTLDSLTTLDPSEIDKRVKQRERELADFVEGTERSGARAGKLFGQMDRTWRLTKSSEEFGEAKGVMEEISRLKRPATQVENYLAAETVKRYVNKNIRKAKSGTGMTRMACSLAFLKQTMSKEAFTIYCRNLNVQRGTNKAKTIEPDRSNPRAIVPEEIGTVDEVYRETRERLGELARREPVAMPDPRDLALMTALSTLKAKGGANGGSLAVEHERLQAEVEKVQSDPRFIQTLQSKSPEELIELAWHGNMDKPETYNAPVQKVQPQIRNGAPQLGG